MRILAIIALALPLVGCNGDRQGGAPICSRGSWPFLSTTRSSWLPLRPEVLIHCAEGRPAKFIRA